MIKVLFVCMGNVCRSPTAAAMFNKKVKEAGLSDVLFADSAATHDYHVGQTPDLRAQLAARKRGLDISQHQARKIQPADFEDSELILTMDWENLSGLKKMCAPAYQHKIHLMMRYASDHDAAIVPDPYYGLNEGFNLVLAYCDDACEGVIDELEKKAKTLQKKK